MCVLCLSLLSHSSLSPQACLYNVYDYHDHHHRCVCVQQYHHHDHCHHRYLCEVFIIVQHISSLSPQVWPCSIYHYYSHQYLYRYGFAVYVISFGCSVNIIIIKIIIVGAGIAQLVVHSARCPAWCSIVFCFGFFFLRYPAISLGFTTFGWDFWVCDRFFNPTIKVVTVRLRGWCVLGVFLLPAFTRLGHECQDLLSLCDEMHVCTD